MRFLNSENGHVVVQKAPLVQPTVYSLSLLLDLPSQHSVWRSYNTAAGLLHIPVCHALSETRSTPTFCIKQTTSAVDQQSGAVRRAGLLSRPAGKLSYQIFLTGCSGLCQRTAALQC